MRNTIASIVEGAIVGVLLGALLAVLRIEVTGLQVGIIIGGVFLSTGIASAVNKLITKGDLLYMYEWIVQYNDHSIIIKAGTSGELHINGTLADRKAGIPISTKAVELNGVLDSGEKVRAVIAPNKIGEATKSGKSVRCELYVDEKPIPMGAA